MKLEWILHSARGKLLRQARAELGQISINPGSIAERQLFLSICRGSFPEADVLLRSERVPSWPKLRALCGCPWN